MKIICQIYKRKSMKKIAATSCHKYCWFLHRVSQFTLIHQRLFTINTCELLPVCLFLVPETWAICIQSPTNISVLNQTDPRSWLTKPQAPHPLLGNSYNSWSYFNIFIGIIMMIFQTSLDLHCFKLSSGFKIYWAWILSKAPVHCGPEYCTCFVL